MDRGRLTGLDALRGVAALVVFLGHVGYLTGFFAIPASYLAVDFFFMLSGYVMARTYEHRLGDDLSAGAFLWLRLKRLWPVCAVGSALAIPLALLRPNPALEIPLALLLVPTFTFGVLYPLNTPLWSIFFELLANLMHGMVLRRISLGGVVIVAAVTCLAIAARTHSYDLGSHPRSFLYGLPRVLLPYSMGVWMWRKVRDHPPRMRPAWAVAPVMVLAIFIFSAGPDGATRVAFVVIVCPLALLGGLQWNAGKLGIIAGALSFPLYAVHFPLLSRAAFYGQSIWPAASLAIVSAALLAFAPKLARSVALMAKRAG